MAAPRFGFAWDINGDGKQALRASTGVFFAMPTRGAWEGFVGDPPAAFNRVVQWATFSDIENFANSDIAFVETPISSVPAVGPEPDVQRQRARHQPSAHELSGHGQHRQVGRQEQRRYRQRDAAAVQRAAGERAAAAEPGPAD